MNSESRGMVDTTVEPNDILAIDGGPRVRSPHSEWPTWPIAPVGTDKVLADVIHSRRWTLTSVDGRELYERRFARAFAEYVNVAHCVPVDHGSSALVIALESLGLDHGSVVLVPALTWVASATAVFRAGLLPVLADVELDTGSIGPDALAAQPEAQAVIAVHWACAMADIPAIDAVARPRGVSIIEDAAQAHGARWLDRPAGSMGRLGCFSMHQSKVLSAAEGGAVVTDDANLAAVLEELRADSRRQPTEPLGGEQLELVETASVMGANFCLDELNAAILCAQLPELDAQHARRNANYELLDALLAEVEGVRLLRARPEQNRRSIYEAPIIFDPLPDGASNHQIAESLTAELGVLFYPPRAPLNRSRLLRPWTKPSIGPLGQRFRNLHENQQYPHAEYFARNAVLTHHRTFLGDEKDMVDIVDAIRKVIQSRRRLGVSTEGV